jgi:hypothetical protein
MMYKRLAALGGAAAATAMLAAGPAVAQGAAVAAGAKCVGGASTIHVINGKRFRTFPVSASGFPAGAAIQFQANGITFADGTADATGALSTIGDPPFFTGRHRAVSLTATDGTTTAGPVKVFVTNIDVTLHASKPTQIARFRAFGFVPGKRIYLFIRHNGHVLGRFSLGKARGACGDRDKRMRAMPLRHYTTGVYQYWYSQRRHFSKATALAEHSYRITRHVL